MTELLDFTIPAGGFGGPVALWLACHQRLEGVCDVLRRFGTHVANFGADETSRIGAEGLRRYFNVAAPRHEDDENLDLFPRTLERLGGRKRATVRSLMERLQDDHVAAARLWQPLDEQLAEVQRGGPARPDRQAIDRLIGQYLAHRKAEEEALLRMARRLARLPVLLGPANPALLPSRERGLSQKGRAGRRPVPRWRLAAAAVAVTILVALVLTPIGQTAVASFMGIFLLGRTQVQISQTGTPVPAGHTAVRESWTLEEAQQRLPFALPQPAYLPEGHELRAVYSYTYPDLPEWVPQPVLVDVDYGNLTLRVYPIMLGDEASISRLNLEATSVEKVQDLEINGQPGVLLRVGDSWQEIDLTALESMAAWAQGQCNFAAAQLLLQATHMGLGSCPIGGFDSPALATAAAIPAGEVPAQVIALGHCRYAVPARIGKPLA